MKKILTQILILLFTFVIMWLSLSIPQTVYNKDDMKEMKFGYPLPFVTQDMTQRDPPFPWKYGFGSPWENPFEVHWLRFIVSFLINLATIQLVVILLKKNSSKSKQ